VGQVFSTGLCGQTQMIDSYSPSMSGMATMLQSSVFAKQGVNQAGPTWRQLQQF
jgi:hypothetical protein